MMSQPKTEPRTIVFLVLPYMLRKADGNKVKLRSYLAFPYGVLSMAEYLRKRAKAKIGIAILNLCVEKLQLPKPGAMELSACTNHAQK